MSAGPAPLYGTCVIAMFAARCIHSKARCAALPLPADAYGSSRGRDRASATNSFTVRVRSDG